MLAGVVHGSRVARVVVCVVQPAAEAKLQQRVPPELPVRLAPLSLQDGRGVLV